jgi:CelD/BcsL family acetyltransferase involved in cellulose biosynthesis
MSPAPVNLFHEKPFRLRTSARFEVLRDIMLAKSSFDIVVSPEIPAFWPGASTTTEAQSHIFQRREFLVAWLAAYGSNPALTPIFVAVRDRAGDLLLLLPLCLERRGGLRRLTFIDQGVSDYNGAVVFPAAAGYPALATGVFWDELFAALPPFDVASFEKLPELVGSAANPAFGLATSSDEAAHGNILVGDWPSVEKANVQSPKEMRKKLRQLERVGPVDLHIAQTPEQRRVLIDRLAAQKQRRYEETHVAGFAEKPEQLAFLRHATEVFAAAGQLVLCALTVGGNVTAIQWGLELDGRFYALVTGYEADWAQYSCGRVLNYLLLRWLHERGFTYFDQGVGNEAYKLDNSSVTVPLARAVIARTIRGRLYVAVGDFAAAFKATALGSRIRQLRWSLARTLKRSN